MCPVKCSPRFLCLALLAGLIVAPAPRASDAPPDWRGAATSATTPDVATGVDVDALAGTSSHVGRFTAQGFHVLNPADFTFQGHAVMTGAFSGIPGEFHFEFIGTLHPRGK